MCWHSMGQAMNTNSAEVQRKIHNLRNQVSVTLCYIVLRTLYEWTLNLPSLSRTNY